MKRIDVDIPVDLPLPFHESLIDPICARLVDPPLQFGAKHSYALGRQLHSLVSSPRIFLNLALRRQLFDLCFCHVRDSLQFLPRILGRSIAILTKLVECRYPSEPSPPTSRTL